MAKKRGLDEGVLERARQAARLSFTLEPPTPEGRQNRNGEHRKERLKLMRADGLTHLKPIAKSPRYLHNLFKMAAVDHYWGPLAELAAALIEAGEPVPLRIRGIVVAKLRELSVEDSYKPEDPKKAKLYRDFTIGNAVSFVSHQTGLPPTRNDATTDAPSACSIVTEVLREFGINRTEALVAKVWSKHLMRPKRFKEWLEKNDHEIPTKCQLPKRKGKSAV